MNDENKESLTLANNCLKILEIAIENSELVEKNRHKEEKLRLAKDVASIGIIAVTIIILNII